MEGALLREQRRLDMATYTAWHTAVFALNGYAGKLKGKSLSDYLSGAKPEASEKLDNAKLIAGFHSLAARGFDVQITRNPIN